VGADAAQSAAWLYGRSLDFLLRQPGERARARQQAALQTALAESELTESIWQVRAALRLALLETDRKRLQLSDIARTQLLSDELELSRAQQREHQSRARSVDAIRGWPPPSACRSRRCMPFRCVSLILVPRSPRVGCARGDSSSLALKRRVGRSCNTRRVTLWPF
jgi:hypothetical protein